MTTTNMQEIASYQRLCEEHRPIIWKRPEFVRGDIGYGTQTWMLELESKGVRYLFKLRQSAEVKEFIAFCEVESEWQQGLGKWQYCESQLQLTGWDCPRRVVIYRLVHSEPNLPIWNWLNTLPRLIDEAISIAGGVDWSELDENLMLKKIPGVYCAGEMIDWEAPTGGIFDAGLPHYWECGWAGGGERLLLILI